MSEKDGGFTETRTFKLTNWHAQAVLSRVRLKDESGDIQIFLIAKNDDNITTYNECIWLICSAFVLNAWHNFSFVL